jgi:hypothetical protein
VNAIAGMALLASPTVVTNRTAENTEDDEVTASHDAGREGRPGATKEQVWYTVAGGESASTTPWRGGYKKLKHQAKQALDHEADYPDYRAA